MESVFSEVDLQHINFLDVPKKSFAVNADGTKIKLFYESSCKDSTVLTHATLKDETALASSIVTLGESFEGVHDQLFEGSD